jgi:hypothetical protein
VDHSFAVPPGDFGRTTDPAATAAGIANTAFEVEQNVPRRAVVLLFRQRIDDGHLIVDQLLDALADEGVRAVVDVVDAG